MRVRYRHQRLIADINIVPYIDVMLVLLIIFMITAPLLSEGVKIDLPQANAKNLTISDGEKPVVVTVDATGAYYLNYNADSETPLDTQSLLTQVSALMRYRPSLSVVVRGDRKVEYGQVVSLMALLQRAGVPTVGLMTKPSRGNNR